MNRFVHRMLGHYLMDAAEEGEDLPGGEEASTEAEEEGEQEEGESEPESEEEGEVVVTIGDAEPDEEEEAKAAPQWVKDLRRERKEDKKRIRELEQQVAKTQPKQEVPALGPEPTLEDCDYDADEFKRRYVDYLGRKQKIEAAERDKQRDAEEQQKAWQQTLDTYQTSKSSLKVKDFEDAEELVVGAFSETQQGVILSGAENAALVVYALGKNPKKSAELSAIKDPIKFAFAIAKLEGQLKVQARKPATKPEGTISGTAPKSGAVDNQLERLRAEAEKSGDYSKVSAYKRQQREKQKA